jgi:cell division septal protein FtsQ
MNWKKSYRARKARKIRAKRSLGKKYYLRRFLGSFKLVLKILLGIIISGGVLYLLLFSNFFKISSFTVTGSKQFVSKEDVEELAKSNAFGKNIFFFNTDSLEDKLSKNLLGAKSFEVTKKLPRQLQIAVYERTPIAIVYQDSEEEYLVDEDGYVLGYANNEYQDLPKIHFEKEIKIGFFIDQKIVPVYLELAQLFEKEKIKVSTMSFSTKDINFQITDGPEVLIGTDKNLQEAVLAISSLLKEAKVENRDLKRVDLRYDKVIVSFR